MCSSPVHLAQANGSAEAEGDPFVERIFEMTIHAMEVATIHLGRKLGLYAALHEAGTLTSVELADRTGTDERYVREWLEQQAVADIVCVDDTTAEPQERRYSLPADRAEALIDHTSARSIGPFAQYAAGAGELLPQLVEAFRTGEGIPWDDFDESRLAQAEVNRGLFTHELGSKWIPALPHKHEQFATRGGRIADVACGAGWSTIETARAYPKVTVDGYDLDEPSIAMAEENLRGSGVEDRVRFEARNGAEVGAGDYDLVTIYEAIHDMANPVEVLAGARRMLAAGGEVLVADEGVAEHFTAPGDEIERVMYGFSVLSCLPASRGEGGPSAAIGTAIRPSTMKACALEAGFSDVEVLDVEHDFWRFYRLVP